MAASTSAPLTDFLARCELYADLDTRLLICCRPSCGFALSTARLQVTSQLREKHSVSKDLRDGLTHHLRHVHPISFVDPAGVSPHPDVSGVHPKLRLYDEYTCRACPYHTINPLIISRYVSKEHRDGSWTSRAELDTFYDDIFLQAWTHRAHGVEQQYWVVRRTAKAKKMKRAGRKTKRGTRMMTVIAEYRKSRRRRRH